MSSNTRPFSLRIFLPSGTPDGLRIIEKSNWSGRGVVCPRTMYTESRLRAEFGKTGVYVLVGPSEVGDLPRVYIGEGDPIRPRLDQHLKIKDFWTSAIFFTSKDANLNKAHIQYLESRLVALARDAKRCVLDNGNLPELPSMSEMDIADAEGFFAEMLLCYPVLGVSVFEKPMSRPARRILLSIAGKGAKGSGYESPDGFVVMAGSTAVIDEVPSLTLSVRELRQQLLGLGVFELRAGEFVVTQDYTFTSPSLAAAVLLGRSANGRVEWVDINGVSLKTIQENSTDLVDPNGA